MPTIELTLIDVPPPTRLDQVRTSKMRQFGPVLSGIDKELRRGPLFVSTLGLPDDEHDLTFHGGIDKAVHQYCSNHYSFWQSSLLDEEDSRKARFVPGGFGENLVAAGFNETNICIGDLVRIGYPNSDSTGGTNGCLLEVSLPRQPCFKLNQRFGIKNFAPRTHQESKTGWYYRVKEEGFIEPGMEIRIVRRSNPTWSIARLHYYVHRDKSDLDISRELTNLCVIGKECRSVFEDRLAKHEAKKEQAKEVWRQFRTTLKAVETPRISRVELQAVQSSERSEEIPFGSYAVIKLPNGLKRPYSVVSGNMDCFVLGIAKDDNSRGGSEYIHDKLKLGDIISVGTIQRSMKSNGMASHYIFIVGGIGITAFLDMMRRIVSINQTLELHYAVRTRDDVAFETLLSHIGPNVKIYIKSEGDRMNIDQILRNRVWNSQVFTCGPQRMIDAVVEATAAAGMTEDEVHYEIFGAETSGDPFSVEVAGKDRNATLEVGSDTSLLEALREAGFEVDSSCEAGNCSTCRVSIRCGKIDHRGTGLTKIEREQEMLSCVSRGIGHIKIELTDV